jgi:glyoxylase-like metal-dependent hydrolase (beta-lactamase superfamily II)
VIDSPVFPDELEALPGVLEQAGFPVSALLATHADWDHLLGRIAFPRASLGCGESTIARLAAEPGAVQRELRDFDDQHYVPGQRVLQLGGVQSLPVPGKLSLGAGDRELQLHPAVGHTSDGTAFWIPWLSVLLAGDYLSPVEIPVIGEGGSVDAYIATLERLRPLVDAAEKVVPGHGEPLERDRAGQLLDEDLNYLSALKNEGSNAQLPPERRSAAQRQIHEANVSRVAATPRRRS